jgi:hypothetical protein
VKKKRIEKLIPRNNFNFLEYRLTLTVAGRVFSEAVLGRAVAMGTVHNEMHGL